MSNPDQVILVDEQDHVIGSMDKVEAHRGEGKLHRAISVYLFNDQGQLLIQQRSAKKIVGAHQWANTCCGNVRPGESYEACAYRRLQEELGIVDVTLLPLYTFQYYAKCNEAFSEREIDHVFVGRFSSQPNPNPAEVQAVAWVTFHELTAQTKYDLAPWFVIMLHDSQLMAHLEKVTHES